MAECRSKQTRPYEDLEEEKFLKAKRHDIEPPMADVDIRLAEKLDNILKISDTRKPKFFTNKPKTNVTSFNARELIKNSSPKNSPQSDKIKLRNLSKEELKERLLKKYDTLVPELDPKRPTVNVVKVLTASQSIELAKSQARKQLDRQLELNSVSGNQQAFKKGLDSFRFNDGYEMPAKSFSNDGPIKKAILSKQLKPNETKEKKDSKSVKFADVEVLRYKQVGGDNQDNNDDSDDDEYDDVTDDLSESDYTTGNEDDD